MTHRIQMAGNYNTVRFAIAGLFYIVGIHYQPAVFSSCVTGVCDDDQILYTGFPSFLSDGIIAALIPIHKAVNSMEAENKQWEELTYEEKNHELFLRQKALLDEFLEHGAISQAQHDKSLHDLMEKMAGECDPDDK